MELDPDGRRRIASRAAQYLRDQDAYWTQRYWLCDLDAMEREENATLPVYADKDTEFTIGQSATMGRIREWIRDHNFVARNRRCGVCAEGALLLAAANDPSIPDEVLGEDLLRPFNEDGKTVATSLGLIEAQDWDGIPQWNDDRASGEDEVLTLLDGIGNLNR